MTKKTIKARVIEKIMNANKTKYQGRNVYTLKHDQIVKLTKKEDSATRRLREIATAYEAIGGDWAYELANEQYAFNTKFVAWLRKTV